MAVVNMDVLLDNGERQRVYSNSVEAELTGSEIWSGPTEPQQDGSYIFRDTKGLWYTYIKQGDERRLENVRRLNAKTPTDQNALLLRVTALRVVSRDEFENAPMFLQPQTQK